MKFQVEKIISSRTSKVKPYRPFIANSNICCGLISKPISLCISLNNLFLIGLGILVSLTIEGNINVDKGVEKDNPCVP
jgi:hypothetical protein